jgi:chromosomal replication initiation ATPase DnaA
MLRGGGEMNLTMTTNQDLANTVYNLLISHKEAEERLEELNDQINKIIPRPKIITIYHIKKVVCNYFRIDINELDLPTRKIEIVQARQIAMYFSRKYIKASLATIGKEIGNRHHATVLWSCQQVENLYESGIFYKEKKIVDYRKIIDDTERLIML